MLTFLAILLYFFCITLLKVGSLINVIILIIKQLITRFGYGKFCNSFLQLNFLLGELRMPIKRSGAAIVPQVKVVTGNTHQKL
jgi:hypothetical protein